MQVTVEKLSPVLVELHVTVPMDRVQASLQRAFDNLGKNAHVKGFRKGKAPKNVLLHLFGPRVEADVASRLVDDTLDKALAEKELRPISKPQIDRPRPKADEDFAYRARFEVTPSIEKVDFEGMKINRPSYPVDDAAIDAEMEKLLERHATLQVPEPARAVKNGDTVVFDFVLDMQGSSKADAGSKGQDISGQVGSSTLLKELSDAFEGRQVSEQFDVPVTFGANAMRKEIVGKKGVFHITLKQIKETVLPDIDDEFAKDVGASEQLEKTSEAIETVSALRNAIRKKLEKQADERADTEMAQAVVVELCKRNPVPVPPSLVQQQAQMQEQEILQNARNQGHSAQSLAPQLRESIQRDAEMKVRAGLLMAEIAKASNMKIGDEQIAKAYEELAEQTGQNINRVKAQYNSPKQRELLFAMILEDMVLTKILDAAIIEGATQNPKDDPETEQNTIETKPEQNTETQTETNTNSETNTDR